jgi:hypothetical protein
MKSWFQEGRDLVVESPQEGFYIRSFSEGGNELRLWEVHAGTKVDLREEGEAWIGMMMAGELEFWMGEIRKNLFPTDVVLLPKNTPYRFRSLGEKSARIVWFRSLESFAF